MAQVQDEIKLENVARDYLWERIKVRGWTHWGTRGDGHCPRSGSRDRLVSWTLSDCCTCTCYRGAQDECYDSMSRKGVMVRGFKSSVLIQSFPMRKRSPAEVQREDRVKLLRRSTSRRGTWKTQPRCSTCIRVSVWVGV